LILIAGNFIYVQFSVPKPPIVFDTDIVSARNNYGFEYFDDSSSAKITNVQIDNQETIKITLDKIPTGSNQRLRYAFTGDPNSPLGTHSSGSPAGNVRDSDNSQSLYGNKLYNWLVHFDKPIPFDSRSK
jgi:hypothetical protein